MQRPSRKSGKKKPSGKYLKFDERVDLFVTHYIANGMNGTKAAIDAGYAKIGAHVTASRLLRNSKVITRLDTARRKLRRNYEITTESVLGELALIAKAKAGWYGKITKGKNGKLISEIYPEAFEDDQLSAAISEFSTTKDGQVRIKLHDKQAALEKLGKYLGIFDKQGNLLLEGQSVELVIRGGLPSKADEKK